MGGMNSGACPVCGHVDGACKGRIPTNERQIITSEGVIKQSGPVRVPKQRSSGLGKAGYVGEASGRVEVYDPAVPNITFVQEADVVEEEAVTGGGADPNNKPQNPPRHLETVSGATAETDEPKPKRSRKKTA